MAGLWRRRRMEKRRRNRSIELERQLPLDSHLPVHSAQFQSSRLVYLESIKGFVVKVMSKALVEKGYYKQEGVVRKVIDKYCGEIEMIEKKHVLRVDQEKLETVLSQIGGLVKIVNGAYRGENVRLLAIDAKKFCAKVQIEKGIYDGRVLKVVEYEDIYKLA